MAINLHESNISIYLLRVAEANSFAIQATHRRMGIGQGQLFGSTDRLFKISDKCLVTAFDGRDTICSVSQLRLRRIATYLFQYLVNRLHTTKEP